MGSRVHLFNTPEDEAELRAMGEPAKPASDWLPAETAPKDGSHILVAFGPYDKWTGFDQKPPCVVHWYPGWKEGNEPEGFYLSHGIVQDSYNDQPMTFSHWQRLSSPPTRD